MVSEALTWKGTPFVWGQCVKGLGVDCGRFLAGVMNGAGVKQIDMASFPQLSPQWFLHKSEDAKSPFVEQILRFTVEYQLTPGRVPQPGDIVVAKFGHDYAHSAIVVAWPQVIASAAGFCVTIWRDIQRSPQYGTRPRCYFDPFDPAAGTGAAQVPGKGSLER